MPGPSSWMSIPTTILDLGQKTADAESWAAAQRAQLAETWANVQRQGLQTMADTYQRGTDTLDHFTGGYQGAQDGSTGSSAPLGYNDMVGASSGPSAGFGSNPQDATSPIDQARDSGQGPQLLGGDTPISGPLNATGIPQAVSAFQQSNLERQRYAFTPTLGTRADQPAREQVQRDRSLTALYTPSQSRAQDEAVQNMVIGTVGEVPEGAGKLLGPAADAAKAGVTRMFHGTGSSFGVPDATKFDPNGLFGPGYYLTSDARVAGSYAGTRAGSPTMNHAAIIGQQADVDALKKSVAQGGPMAKYWQDALTRAEKKLEELQARSGAQTRAVNVPNSLKLLDADKPVPRDALDAIDRSYDLRGGLDIPYGSPLAQMKGDQVWRGLSRSIGPTEARDALSSLGYDGIQYTGGKRTPMRDDAGNAIEHTAVVIFPESMGKLTNAISGTRFGSPPAVGGAIVGGLAGAQQGNTPEERARNALLGTVGGGVGGHLLGSGQLGRLASDESGMIGRAPKTAVTGGERAGNILLKKYDPGVQDVIDEAASTNPNRVEAARRGVVSDAEVQQLADAAGESVGKIIARWKPGQAANAETIQALRTALDSQARKVLDAQQAIQSGDNSTASQLRFQLAVKEHLAVQQAVSGVTAEAGRGLRVLRQSVQQALQSNDVGRMQSLLKKLGGAEWTDELSAKLGQLDTSDPTAVHTFLRDIAKPKAADRLNAIFYNAILSNPATHIANTLSNTVNAALGPVERLGAAAVEAPLAALQGRPRERFFGEARANTYGLLRGIPEGVRAFTYTMAHGFSEMAAVKGEMPKAQPFSGRAGAALTMPSRLLTAEDSFFDPILTRGATNALIFRKAAAEGLSGTALKARIAELTANVPVDIYDQATKETAYRLYRQEADKFGAWLSKGRDTVSVGPVQPLRFIFPFVQVSMNATKYGLERSPLGFLSRDLWANLAKQSPEAADNIARLGMGSLIAAGIGAEVAAGNLDITGAAPTDPTKRDAFYRQGKLPYAVKVGGVWRSYQRWEPFNHALTQVAAGVDAIRDAKAGADPVSIAGQAGVTIAQNVLSQQFLSGISSFMNAISDPDRYLDSWVAQLETSVVPGSALLRATANTMDPRQRAPKNFVENVENITPGLSRNVPSRLNNYGEEQGIAGSPFLPYKSQTANDSPLEMELARLRVEPGAAGKSVRGIDLTRQENQDYQRLSGGLVKAALTQVLNDPRYRGLDDTRKAAALTRIIGHAKDLAAQRFIGQLAASQGKAALLQRIAAKKRAALPRAG